MNPTDAWLAQVDQMPPLPGPAGTAERLLLLVHYGIDWENGWVGGHRERYWTNILPDRVVAATFCAGTLRRWWCETTNELGSQPRNAAERAETEQLLRADTDPVIELLRLETDALILRTRIVADTVRSNRENR